MFSIATKTPRKPIDLVSDCATINHSLTVDHRVRQAVESLVHL
ncbi:hypothetical protein I546_2691 [Mycobacterium kansasii 732]|nr:hypothetical protein I546_2691 [Mycobacterium kansasii 732]